MQVILSDSERKEYEELRPIAYALSNLVRVYDGKEKWVSMLYKGMVVQFRIVDFNKMEGGK
jgi:hypothetical protein